MAKYAVAQDAICALRRQIAVIEGRPAAADDALRESREPVLPRQRDTALRPAPAPEKLVTGAEGLDRALGGGIGRACLCEIHVGEARDAGAGAGFALALASLARKDGGDGPVLWAGTMDGFRESGFPHAAGLQQAFALPPQDVLIAQTRKPSDALWVAGESAGLDALAAVIIEMHGDPTCLDLTATRRLHRRARTAGRPVFLLRLSARRQPTAAPVRLGLAPAPASPRVVFGQPLAGSLGLPAFTVTLEKCRANPGAQFIVEWDCNEHRFLERQPDSRTTHPVPVVSASFDRPDPPPSFRQIVALGSRHRRKAG